MTMKDYIFYLQVVIEVYILTPSKLVSKCVVTKYQIVNYMWNYMWNKFIIRNNEMGSF